MNVPKFVVEIQLGNDALPDNLTDAAPELARILVGVAHKLENTDAATWPLRDINGNTVGRAGLRTDEG